MPESVVPVSGTGVPQLLNMYEQAMEDSASLPPLILVRCRPSRWRLLKPLAWLPRMTFGTRMFLIRHIERSLLTLERHYHVQEALGKLSPEHDRDRSACSAYRKSLPPSRFALTVIGFAASAAIVASIIIQITGRAAKSTGKSILAEKATGGRNFLDHLLLSFQDDRLEDSFQEIDKESVSLMTGGGAGDLPKAVGDAIQMGAAGLLVLFFIIFVTGYAATRPFVSAFRLKRQTLSLADQDELSLQSTASSWFVNKSVGIYEQERKVFKALERKQVPEKPIDLVVLSFPAACLLTLAILLAWLVAKTAYGSLKEPGSWQEWVPTALATCLYVLWLGVLGVFRVMWLSSVLKDRRNGENRNAPFVGKVRATGLYVEARPAIETAAWPVAAGLFIYSWLLYPLLGAITFHRIVLAGNRLSGRGGHPVAVTLAFASVVATPIVVSRQLWRLATLDGHNRRNKILATVACPALFVLPVTQIVSLRSLADPYLEFSLASWLFLYIVASGLLSALLYALLIAAVQQCQNGLIRKMAAEVKYGECEGVSSRAH
ncbi:hypothetical protein [Streptomyces sp. NPDC047061]|uniref:hypothetical protein n=1 Tax=Streptomyces sp. NPDC047061 TaxID=3154605 RepID=UPI0033F8AA62